MINKSKIQNPDQKTRLGIQSLILSRRAGSKCMYLSILEGASMFRINCNDKFVAIDEIEIFFTEMLKNV